MQDGGKRKHEGMLGDPMSPTSVLDPILKPLPRKKAFGNPDPLLVERKALLEAECQQVRQAHER
jgi:hypothetical protein